MDDPVKRRLAVWCGAAVLFACVAAAQAQSLNDPTRPPASLLSPQTVPAANNAPQLQSVLIARHPGGRHVAVIDGQTLRLGDSYRGAVLERVSENEVVLRKGAQRQVLKLYAAASGNTTRPAARAE